MISQHRNMGRWSLGRGPGCAVVAVGACAMSAGLLGGCIGGQDIVTFAGEYRQQGIKLYNEGNFPDATAAFNNAIRQDPRDYQSVLLPRPQLRLDAAVPPGGAVVSHRAGRDGAVARGCEDTIFRQKVLDGMAAAAAAGNSPELERAAMQDRRQPTVEDAFVQAKVARIHGDVDSAIEAYTKAALLDPNNVYVAKEFGMYLSEVGQTQRSAPQLKRALRAEPPGRPGGRPGGRRGPAEDRHRPRPRTCWRKRTSPGPRSPSAPCRRRRTSPTASRRPSSRRRELRRQGNRRPRGGRSRAEVAGL